MFALTNRPATALRPWDPHGSRKPCTRFVKDIILHRATSEAVTIKVVLDVERRQAGRDHIEAFQESISDLEELPSLKHKATTHEERPFFPGLKHLSNYP